MNIDRDTMIGDLLDADCAGKSAGVLRDMGMFCTDCPSARGETLEEACEIHGVDIDKLLQRLNRTLSKQQE